MGPYLSAFALASTIAFRIASAQAAPVTDPDEVCAPDADPCVIDRPIEVSFDHPLDFGTRVVRIEGNGHLTGTLNLLSGGFVADVDGNWMDVAPQQAYQRVEIFTRRACSLDPSIACTSNARCRAEDAGMCTAGDGRILLGGKFFGVSPIVTLLAAGDLTIRGAMRTAGNSSVPDANTFSMASLDGDLRVNAPIDASAGFDSATGTMGRAGSVTIGGGGDVFVNRRIRAIGRWGGFSASPKGDVTVRAPILLHGGRAGPAPGGFFTVDARGSFTLERRPGAKGIRVDLRGGFRNSTNGVEGGSGGHGEINVRDAIHLDPKAMLLADGWYDDHEWYGGPGGGTWSFTAQDAVEISNSIHARGLGAVSTGGSVSIDAPGASFLANASILVNGEIGGTFSTYLSSGGSLEFSGLIDARGADGTDGRGGSVTMDADDLTIDGSILNGGGSRGGLVLMDACHLQLGTNARIDGSHFAQTTEPGRNLFWVHGSMTAADGSVIRGVPGSTNQITYRNAGQPPDLLGTVEPAASLLLDAGLFPCLN